LVKPSRTVSARRVEARNGVRRSFVGAHDEPRRDRPRFEFLAKAGTARIPPKGGNEARTIHASRYVTVYLAST
jgi:hypothetical protein